MIGQSKHIIEKILLEFNTVSEQQGKQLELQSTSFVQHKLLPELESLLNQYSEFQNIRFDKLAFEIDINDAFDIEQQLLHQIINQLSNELKNTASEETDASSHSEDLF